MTQSRGYIDVNPQNCWADWHRLRAQMTGGYLPKIILCIPGDDAFRARCEPILQAEKIENEFRPHDPKLLNAFRKSSMTWPAFRPEDFARIDAHSTVLYVLSRNFTSAAAPANGRAFLTIGRRLLEAGGIAIKCESSGISHSPARWTQFDNDADRSARHRWFAVLHAYVVFPIGSKVDLYSCGMHLVGAPDMIVSPAILERVAKPGQSTVEVCIELFRTFAMYLLAECPVGNFASGHAFSLEKDAPRYHLVWEPCSDMAENTLFHNPFGRWRFTQA